MTLSYGWLVLKDAGWLGAIGVICLATFAVSPVTRRSISRWIGGHLGLSS